MDNSIAIEAHIKTMPDYVRALMLKVWNGYQPVVTITNPLYHLYAHFPRESLEKALSWLVRNKKVGFRFVTFYQECGGTNLNLHKKLLEIVTQDNSKIIAGQNFRI